MIIHVDCPRQSKIETVKSKVKLLWSKISAPLFRKSAKIKINKILNSIDSWFRRAHPIIAYTVFLTAAFTGCMVAYIIASLAVFIIMATVALGPISELFLWIVGISFWLGLTFSWFEWLDNTFPAA